MRQKYFCAKYTQFFKLTMDMCNNFKKYTIKIQSKPKKYTRRILYK